MDVPISVLSATQQQGCEVKSVQFFFFGFAMGQNCYEDLDVNGKTIMTWVLKHYVFIFTLMLPCILIDFFLNNQPDPLIIQIYCYKTLHVTGIFSAHHQEFSTVHSALVCFMQVFDGRFQAESGS